MKGVAEFKRRALHRELEMKCYIVQLLVLVSLSTATLGCSGHAVPMKKFTVDLDMPPEERWIELISHYNSSAPLIVDYFNSLEKNEVIRDAIELIMADLDGLLGDLGKEMRSIADYMGIDLGIIVTLNFAYELRKLGGGHSNTTNGTTPSQGLGFACTSIVAQDEDGAVFHGRNLDWNIPNDIRNLSVQADFVKNGEVIFSGVATAGFVGILTGMSRSGFSVTINERDLGGDPLVDALEALFSVGHAWSPTHLARKILTTASSYSGALELLKKELLTAPTYFIVAGTQPNQGAVVTRDRNLLADLWALNVSPTVPNSWYLLETNYDHWKPVYPYDNRRYYGNKYMQSIGQKDGATMQGLLEVLGYWPIQNNLTAYTSLMYPEGNRMESYDIYCF